MALVGIKWVFPLIVRETLLSWRNSFVGKKRKKAWMVASLRLFWTIWQERNMIVFYDEVFSAHDCFYDENFLFFFVIGGHGLQCV